MENDEWNEAIVENKMLEMPFIPTTYDATAFPSPLRVLSKSYTLYIKSVKDYEESIEIIKIISSEALNHLITILSWQQSPWNS